MPHLDHTHTMPDFGTETGLQIIDPTNGDLHWHLVDGVRTEGSKPFGPEHTHILDGQETSLQELKSINAIREVKLHSGVIKEYKQEQIDGVETGVFEGYIATWDLDRGAFGVRDQFVRGAFLESLADHRDRDNRPIRLKDHHGRTVGKFPIEFAREDERGLFAVGHINLGVQQGRELFSLIKQGTLTDMSIGFSSVDDSEVTIGEQRIRRITKAIVFEGSVVDEPMNQQANITEVKSVMPFQDLPIAARDVVLDSKSTANSILNIDSFERKKAFLWNNDYKSLLQIAYVIDGDVVAIPKAIFVAAAQIENGSSGIPASDLEEVKENLEGYYEKMGLPSPFDEEKSFSVELTTRNVEKALRCYGFSKSESKSIAGQVKVDKPDEDTQNVKSNVLLVALKSLIGTFEKPA